jgi:hypothetical protein
MIKLEHIQDEKVVYIVNLSAAAEGMLRKLLSKKLFTNPVWQTATMTSPEWYKEWLSQ